MESVTYRHVPGKDTATHFGFERIEACMNDPDLAEHVQQCLRVGPSHELPLTNLTPQMRWYYGRNSNRNEPVLQPIHRRRRQR